MYAVCFWTKDQKVSKNNFKQYLDEKLANREKPITTDPNLVSVMLCKAFSKYSKHFLYFEMPLQQHNRPSYLYDIDNLLRTVWLECCGHLSKFEDNKRNTRIDIIPVGVKIKYEYDFGSTTHLILETIAKYAIDKSVFDAEKVTLNKNDMILTSSKEVDYDFKTISTDVVLAFRNKGKFYKKPCSKCGGTFHVSYFKNDKELCFDCAKTEVQLDHNFEIRNSPRIPCGEDLDDDDE